MRNDSKARDIFYGIVAVATLIVAIIGATLAYFSMTASSNEGAINATAAIVSVEYSDGQQVTAQADKLIPAEFAVVKEVYEHHNIATQRPTEEEPQANMCIDKNDKQVCSIYRFTVSSETESEIIAFLNNEHNGFENLSYAVYDVTNNKWLELRPGVEDILLDYCDNENEDAEKHCYKIEGTKKTYTVNNERKAINSMFGYTEDSQNKGQTMGGKEKSIQTYDLVLFLKESYENQNSEQGKNYRGTIMVEILEGGTGGNGEITGEGW